MLKYSGTIKLNDSSADFNFIIGTFLGAVKYRFNIKDADEINGLYIFGKKINRKKKVEEENPESSIPDNNSNQASEETGDTEPVENQKPKESLGDKIKGLINKAETILNDGSAMRCKDLLLEVVIKLLRHIFPRKLEGHLRYGFDDPSYTGKVLALLAAVYPLTQGKFQVTPEWNMSIIDTEAVLSGRIHLSYVLIQAVRVWFNKDFQSVRRNYICQRQ